MFKILLVLLSIFLSSCSFDNKTGIWKDASKIPVESSEGNSISEDNSNQRYEDIFVKNQIFNEEKASADPKNIIIDEPIKISNWLEEYALPTNNISNYFYDEKNILISKSPKLSKFSDKKNFSSRNFIYYQNNLISYDHKGTVFIYSTETKKKIFEYNFYRKNFKNFDKELYLTLDKNNLFIADNLGYLYLINIETKNLVWAKNYGIPFRSNIKYLNNQIFLANQDNVIYSINAQTGDKNWQFATNLTSLKTDFINNIALDNINNNILFLNTSGELYSINYVNQRINWILNFQNSSLVNDTSLFISFPIIIKNENLIVSTAYSVLSYNHLSTTRNWTLPVEPVIKPIITQNYTYVISKNNLLICVNNLSGEIIWSRNLFKEIESKRLINKIGNFYDFKIVNNHINIYSKEGYLLSYDYSNGQLLNFKKISRNGINSKVFFIGESMFLIDGNNRLLKYN